MLFASQGALLKESFFALVSLAAKVPYALRYWER